jgi:hypothetical protein
MWTFRRQSLAGGLTMQKRRHTKVELAAFYVNILLLTFLWVYWRTFEPCHSSDHPCFVIQQLGRGLGSVFILGVLLMADIVLAIAWIGHRSPAKQRDDEASMSNGTNSSRPR